ncbi:M4 family metallopeptidase [Clostridium oryzae]|uniref:Bacillolysin n=1 Tax=Clostridium oryzae TaxID=1450648 RepID=A0A1V4ILQ5_9CLOT|nr:M4 family metallopeptidase [Clostridium oryzae]OPJ60750.1 bacillolysin precursor [Clostridium oryzae]
MKKSISIFLSLALLSSVPAYAKNIGTLKNGQAIDNDKKIAANNININKKSGQLFISGRLSGKQTASKKTAINFLEKNKNLLSVDNPYSDLKFEKSQKDDTGDTFVKFAQVINGVKVENSSINVHFDKDGSVASINGNTTSTEKVESLGNKLITENDAVNIAEKQFNYETLKYAPKVEKVILNNKGKNYEVYKVNIFYISPTIGNYDVYIEVNSGKVIKIENNIHYDGMTTGTGIDVLGNSVNLNLNLSLNLYQMKDFSRSEDETKGIYTFSLNHRTSGRGTLVSSFTNAFTQERQKPSVSAHYNAGKVLDFYKNLFDRNSLDDKGMEVDSYTSYDYKFNNAFWDGSEMVYGDGDGKQFTYLSGDLSIVAHEMTHGVIQNTANLSSDNQQGALNESMADVFGVLISTYTKYNVASGGNWEFNSADWVVGDKVYTPGISGDALRSLADPKLYDQPDNMSHYDNEPDTEEGDYGGVHENCGITNKAAYLIAKNIGMEKTARIYYRALTAYLDAYSDFEDARNCLVQAAQDLYGEGSNEVDIINSAFNSVGIVQVTGIKINKTSISLKTGKSVSLSPEVQPANATNKNVTWESSDTSAVKVDSNGKITALKPGKAEIIVKTAEGGYTAECNVTVSLAAPASVTAKSSSSKSITISWKKVTAASGYKVYRAASSKGTYKLTKTTASTKYKDTGLKKGKTYYYKIKAYETANSKKVYSSFTSVVHAKSK